MGAAFDPYHHWLSIPTDEQPPNHYRLLGLRPLEGDSGAIASAAERQIRHVRSFLNTPLHSYAANLVGELQVARRCLLDSEAKGAYDAWLQQLLTSSPHQRGAPPDAAGVGEHGETGLGREPVSTVAGGLPPSVVTAPRRRRREPTLARFAVVVWWLLGAAIGLLAGYSVLCMMGPSYDFLHLMSRPISPEVVQSPRESVSTPDRRQLSATSPRHTPGTVAPPQPPPSRRVPSERVAKKEADAPDSPERIAVFSAPDPLAGLPPELPLRSPRQVDGPQQLVPIPMDSTADLQLSLVDGGDGVDGQLRIAALADSDSAHRSWTVEWVPSMAESQDVGHASCFDVGRFIVADDQLSFAWAADVLPAAETALVNSVVHMRVDVREHAVVLRSAASVLPLTVDLKDPISRFNCKCDDMPDLSRIRLDITDLSSFPAHRVDGAGLQGMKVGDETTLWYSGVDGAATRLTLVRRGNLVALEAESRYRLPSGDEEPMSIRRGNQKMKQLQDRLRAATRAQADVPSLKRYVKTELPRKLTQAQAMSTGARLAGGGYVESPELAMKKRLLIAQINDEIKLGEQRLATANSLTEAIPEIQKDVATIAQVAQLARQIHGSAKVAFRIYFTVDGHEVDLARSQ